MFRYIFSGINNEYAPGKACWALRESQGNRVVRERQRESEQTEKLLEVRDTAEEKEKIPFTF